MPTELDALSRPDTADEKPTPPIAAPIDPLPTWLDPKHGETPRRLNAAAVRARMANQDPGKFGKMFPLLCPLVVGDDALFALAEAMKDTQTSGGNNPAVPAGFTYFGQFVDHDITLDLTPINARKQDPKAIKNFRSPALDLDALYGLGPQQQPFMYEREASGKITAKFLIGKTGAGAEGDPGGALPVLPNDLPRNSVGRALIGDERNDENLLVAQTHLAFLKFHNAVVQWLLNNGTSLRGGELFDEARRITTWHYQWIALFDFVERLTEPGLVRRIKDRGRQFYRFETTPYIPVEFSAAAYRLGHSMVRERYDHNRVFNSGAIPATLGLLFKFTGKSGTIFGDLVEDAAPGDLPPGATKRLPSNWVIDWRRFYDFGPLPDGITVNATRALDPFVTPALHTLPGEDPASREANLPFRNLRRGVMLELPSGQDVAKAIGVAALTPEEIATGPDGEAAAAHGLHIATPLWYYILKEASVRHGGARLGPVGSTIVAETFLGLVHGDYKSFLWLRKDWKPELPSAQPGHFTMVDLLNFVGDLNPIG